MMDEETYLMKLETIRGLPRGNDVAIWGNLVYRRQEEDETVS